MVATTTRARACSMQKPMRMGTGALRRGRQACLPPNQSSSNISSSPGQSQRKRAPSSLLSHTKRLSTASQARGSEKHQMMKRRAKQGAWRGGRPKRLRQVVECVHCDSVLGATCLVILGMENYTFRSCARSMHHGLPARHTLLPLS